MCDFCQLATPMRVQVHVTDASMPHALWSHLRSLRFSLTPSGIRGGYIGQVQAVSGGKNYQKKAVFGRSVLWFRVILPLFLFSMLRPCSQVQCSSVTAHGLQLQGILLAVTNVPTKVPCLSKATSLRQLVVRKSECGLFMPGDYLSKELRSW